MGLTQYYDAQVAVIGSLLIEPEKLTGEIMYRCRVEDFNSPQLRTLFAAAQTLFLESIPIDPVSLLAKAGKAYEDTVREILMATPTAANWEVYVQILRNESTLAHLKAIAEKIMDTQNADEALKLVAGTNRLYVDRPGVNVKSIQQGLDDLVNWLHDPAPPQYLKWGIRPMDDRLTAEEGDFIIIGADSSVGKTAFAFQLAYTMAKSGKRVGIFSLETSTKKAYDRVFARVSKIKLSAIKYKRASNADFDALQKAREEIKNLHLDILHTPDITVPDMRAITLSRKYDVIFVDYVQIVRYAGRDRADTVANVSMQLHAMAQALGVTIIALSQLTPPDAKKDRYRLNHKEDLRESRQLINDADIIMVMSRTDQDDMNFREVIIDKNKDGELGTVQLDFIPDYMEFVPHVPTRKEQYQNVAKACAVARKEYARQTEPEYYQTRFSEMADDEGGKLPF